VRVLVEIDSAGLPPVAACRVAVEIEAALDAAGVTAERLHHGFGPATWSVIRQGLDLGRDVRIGLEDVLTLPDGAPAPGNAELAAAAVALARA
jgi:uncharacterized protein (DUF849 family)